ncbi:hypothetical protein SUGI_0184600 [Cryptomeria japonica]|nr:hypothetical protein SUGI_0184600 [Cryptomeria japonica]
MQIIYANYYPQVFWHWRIGYTGGFQGFAGLCAVLNKRERTSPEAAGLSKQNPRLLQSKICYVPAKQSRLDFNDWARHKGLTSRHCSLDKADVGLERPELAWKQWNQVTNLRDQISGQGF